MVGNIDRPLAHAILDKCFRGLVFDTSLRRHFVHVSNVEQHTMRKLVAFARTRGIRLQNHDLNDFLRTLSDIGHSMKKHYTFTMADEDILAGEAFRVYLNNMETYVELLKAKAQDYIVVNIRGNSLTRAQYIHIPPNSLWQPGQQLSFGQENSQHTIKDVEFLTPCVEHRYLDWWLEPNLAEYEMTANLWPLYNITHDMMDNRQMQRDFEAITREYLHQGMSVFTLYRVILSIENYWYETET